MSVVRLSLSSIALLAFVLGGCDAWKDRKGYYTYCDATGCYTCNEQGCSLNNGAQPGAGCRASAECAAGCYCESKSGTCVEAGFCDATGDCSTGMTCDVTRHSCQPGPSNAGGGGGQPDAGTPQPVADLGGTPATGSDAGGGGQPGAQCKADCDCALGQVCSNGTCVASVHSGANMCVFNNECGASGECVNGMCHRGCTTDASCGTGDTCQNGFCFANPKPVGGCVYNSDCATGAECVNGACHAGCAGDTDCTNPVDFCDHSLCQPDWRKSPQCRINADCASGTECVNAVCRTHCWTDTECGACVGMPTCHLGYCMGVSELTPMCKLQSDCGAAQSCVNASCQ